MPTIKDIHEHFALLPEWGKRDEYSIIKIPKGTDVTFMSGKAIEQFSNDRTQYVPGGGYQTRFKNFDMKWIIKNGKINKPEK